MQIVFFFKSSGNGFKKKKKTTKQYFTKNIIVFLLNNVVWANRKGETKLYFLITGRKEKKNILDEILFSLFSCFLNPFPC